MSGKTSRTKGHDFERAIAKKLRKWYPDAKRGYQTRGGTQEEYDVEGTPWAIECKKQKSQPSIAGAMNQVDKARKQRNDTRPALVVTRKDRCDILVTMKMYDFERLLDRLHATEKFQEKV